ncbi:hypothetical protein ACOSQ2_009402 [Xanthoceras sorbifolium]
MPLLPSDQIFFLHWIIPRFKFTWRLAKGETHLGTDRTVLGTNKWICLLW